MPYERITISIPKDLHLSVLSHQVKLIKERKKTITYSAAICNLVAEGLK